MQKIDLDRRLGNYVPENIHVARTSRGNDEVVGWMLPKLENEKWLAERVAKMDKWGKLGNLEIENKFTSGFAMIKQVSHSNGFGNAGSTYWRVLHPMGFEFEITLDNFEYILERYTLSQGLICNEVNASGMEVTLEPAEFKLVYKKRSRKWILVDEWSPYLEEAEGNIIPFSQEHKDAEAAVRQANKKVTATVGIGDICTWGYDRVQFIGVMSLRMHSGDLSKAEIKRIRVFRLIPKHNHNTKSVEYIFRTSMPDLRVLEKAKEGELTIEDTVAEINSYIQTGIVTIDGVEKVASSYYDNNAEPIGAWVKKPKKCELVQVPVTIDDVKDAGNYGLTLKEPNALATRYGHKANCMVRKISTQTLVGTAVQNTEMYQNRQTQLAVDVNGHRKVVFERIDPCANVPGGYNLRAAEPLLYSTDPSTKQRAERMYKEAYDTMVKMLPRLADPKEREVKTKAVGDYELVRVYYV